MDTRIEKLRRGEYDAIVLATAGIARLGRASVIDERLTVDQMVPAPAQGALAVQCRRGDTATLAALATIHHGPTAQRVAVERAFLEAISGNCDAPAACLAWFEGTGLAAEAYFAPDPTDPSTGRRLRLRSDPLHADALGRELANRIRG